MDKATTIKADPQLVNWAADQALEVFTPTSYIDGPKPQLDKLATVDETTEALMAALLLHELVVRTGGGSVHISIGTLVLYLAEHDIPGYGKQDENKKIRHLNAGLTHLAKAGFVEFYNEEATALLRQYLAWHAIELLGAHLARQVLGTTS